MVLTTAVKSSEYNSCTSTFSTSNPVNVRSPSHAASGCRFRMLNRILDLPSSRSTTTAVMSTYAALPRCWTHPGYEGPALRLVSKRRERTTSHSLELRGVSQVQQSPILHVLGKESKGEIGDLVEQAGWTRHQWGDLRNVSLRAQPCATYSQR